MEHDMYILLQTINEKIDQLTKFLVGKLEEAEQKAKPKKKKVVVEEEEPEED